MITETEARALAAKTLAKYQKEYGAWPGATLASAAPIVAGEWFRFRFENPDAPHAPNGAICVKRETGECLAIPGARKVEE